MRTRSSSGDDLLWSVDGPRTAQPTRAASSVAATDACAQRNRTRRCASRSRRLAQAREPSGEGLKPTKDPVLPPSTVTQAARSSGPSGWSATGSVQRT